MPGSANDAWDSVSGLSKKHLGSFGAIAGRANAIATAETRGTNKNICSSGMHFLSCRIAQVLLVYTNVPSYFETLVEGNPQTCERSINFGRQTVVSVVSVLNALCYTNSCVNPILYAMLSENFKKSFAAACYGRRHVELERPSAPDQSIYQRSRASIRRHLRQSRDEDDEEHPFTPRTEEKVEETCFLKVPGQNGVVQLGAGMRYRNGSADLTTATTGDHTTDDQEDAV